jgi:hypothetical protein
MLCVFQIFETSKYGWGKTKKEGEREKARMERIKLHRKECHKKF